jgi:SAM-dependent methyltransferase
VCAASTTVRYAQLFDDRYGHPGFFMLRACTRCGHSHVPAQFTPEDLSRLYTTYYPRGNFDIESFAPEIEKSGFKSWLAGDRASAFRWVPREVRVLDIGCGIGATLAYHKNRGCQATGVETDENVQAIARRHGLDIRTGVFDSDSFAPESFDYVTLDQVAEHVTDPRSLFQGVAKVLKKDGTVVMTTPNANGFGAHVFARGWLNWHAPYHLQFYTRRSVAQLARVAGLRLVKTTTITASEWQYYQWRHLLAFPEPGERSSFWTGSAAKPMNRWLTKAVSFGHRWRLHQLVSRFLDVLQLGDNRIYILKKL